MAGIGVVLWEHCITLISKRMCQDERVPLCLLSAVENGQEGGGKERGYLSRGEGGKAQRGHPSSPAQAALLPGQGSPLTDSPFMFMHGDGPTVPEAESSAACPQPSLLRCETTAKAGI